MVEFVEDIKSTLKNEPSLKGDIEAKENQLAEKINILEHILCHFKEISLIEN